MPEKRNGGARMVKGKKRLRTASAQLCKKSMAIMREALAAYKMKVWDVGSQTER